MLRVGARVRSLRRLALSLSVAGFASAAPAETPSDHRLDALRPSALGDFTSGVAPPLDDLPRYTLHITLGSDLGSFSLTEDLSFENTTSNPIPDVLLRVFANAGSENPPVSFSSAECPDLPCRVLAPDPSSFLVVPTAALAPGERLDVRLRFHGTLRRLASGETSLLGAGLESLTSLFGGSQTTDYGLLANGNGVASLANFYAVLERRSRAGWAPRERTNLGDLGSDDLAMVSAVVVTPKDVRIAATGAVLLAPSRGAFATYLVPPVPVREFAFLASRNFVTRAKTVGDVTVRSHFVSQDGDCGVRALDTAANALRILEHRLGPNAYPYRELDVVEAPVVGGAGGVEFSGMVTISSSLCRSPTAGLGDLAGVLGGLGDLGDIAGMLDTALEFTTAHEVAHQYFHVLVGSDSREHPYQDETLAQFGALLYFEDRRGAARAHAVNETQVLAGYRMMRLLGVPDGPVDRPVDAFGTPLAYAGLVYGKGAALYPALRKLVGDGPFFRAIRAYVKTNRFRVAAPRALVEEVARVAADGAKVRSLADRYLDQMHGDEDIGQLGGSSFLRTLMGDGGSELLGD